MRDATAGYRLFRRTTLEKIDLDDVSSYGYVFQADLAFRTLRAGLRVVEVPIEFVERVRGDSKMTRDVATESLRRITRWGLCGASPPASRAALPPSGVKHPRRLLVEPLEGRVMKRKFPWWLLLAAFVLVPLVEIYVIIQVGQVIGAWWTILLLIADSMLGSWLVKREGARAWRALRSALDEGRMPATELADGDADPGRRPADAHARLRARHRRGVLHPAVHPPDRPPGAGRLRSAAG